MRHRKKLNRIERKAENREKLKAALCGEGLYVYRNRTKGELTLAKPATNGVKTVAPGAEFTGDNYFMFMVSQTHEAALVRTIEQPKEIMMEQKLIVDQPDCVTIEGKVEHVVVQPKEKPLNEEVPEDAEKDILLVDDAMDGIEIILE